MPKQATAKATSFERTNRRMPNTSAHISGLALLAVAAGILVSTLVEAAYGDPGTLELLASAGIVATIGFTMWRATTVPARITRAAAFASATSVWLGISAAGAVPFLLTGLLPNPELAFFESVSGFTATGATVLSPIEGNGHGILFFRQLTQWFGSMGMVVLAVAVLRTLGVGGMQLLSAEAPGPDVDRLAPRVAETAKHLWTIYVVLTLLGTAALLAVGVGPYDAVTHAMTGIATGGFSPHDASINYFDSVAVEIVIIAIMFIGAVNFALMWRVGRVRSLRPLFAVAEFRFYVGVVLGSTAFITAVLAVNDGLAVPSALRGAAFNVVSLMSTCGFGTADFVQWTPAAQLVLLFLMVTGAMAGSTSGAVKLFRIQVALKHAAREIRRVRHPQGVYPIRLGDMPVTDRVAAAILGFLMFYFVLAVAGIALLSLLGADLPTAAGSIATAMGGVGPGLGETGPASNFLALDVPQRVVMDVYMLLGRLEIIPVLATAGLAMSKIPSVRRIRREVDKRAPATDAVPEGSRR